ncbi:GCN5 family N-acetyltransferase [Formosimonas limnophila]|uniref:GCN5 family N-acetyltransferase n=1 Tax=Formosimonas limnophila TaxID=1384487 RepID=A0A8J3CJI2_9BURK|nr:GNAT family protein [Formosimonas limnophila]GHA64732.1 GCN5 family N-acetyltransferase [Formosimonas limnophila]
MSLTAVTLDHEKARLELTSMAHLDGLKTACMDGELNKLWYTFIPTADNMATEINRRLDLYEKGSMVPYTIIQKTESGERVIGMTSFMHIENTATYNRVEIGSTWYAQSSQRTGLNTIVKRMMLAHAFEVWQCIAVEFRTHRLNTQSRNAIERLGAQLDGMLRAHSLMPNGTLRDTALYSIIAAEWPTIKTHLDFKISQPPQRT